MKCGGKGEKMDKEKVYIGTKIIRAIEMTERMFIETVRKLPFEDKENSPGYKVTYEDGYVSWSPKGTFERAYREITEAEKTLVKAT